MPRKRNTIRRRGDSCDITAEQIETLISGDWEHGAIIPRRAEYAGPAFRDLAHARSVWVRNFQIVLKTHRVGWEEGDFEPTMALSLGKEWTRHPSPCWAAEKFGLPRGARVYLAILRDAEKRPRRPSGLAH